MEGSKPESLCLVCGDKASGKHYGVPSCDGCRGFFKRSIRRNLDYVCKENGRCVVDVSRRNQCQACRFSKCLRVNMKKDAVQHERAPRPVSAQHQIALQKLGYNFSRQSLFPPSSPFALSTFPPFHAYNTLPDRLHNPFLENSTIRDFSRLPETIPPDIPQLSPLLSTQGSLASLSPFKIPLFPTPLHYPVPHPGYFPPNIFYPSVISEQSLISERPSKSAANALTSSNYTLHNIPEQPDSQLPDKLKEDEVSSTEETCKTDNTADETKFDGTKGFELRTLSICPPPIHLVSRRDKDIQLDIKNDNAYADLAREHQKTIRQAESTIRCLREGCESNSLRCESLSKPDTMSAESYDPAARLLVASVRWMHGVSSFEQMSQTEQMWLLYNNWRELFLLTAAQYSYYFDEDHILAVIASKRERKAELRKLVSLLKRIEQYSLDKTEYDYLKTVLLFRIDSTDGQRSTQMELFQEQTLTQLQRHCASKDTTRLAKLMLLLPNVCVAARQGLLEHILFSTTLVDDINSILSRILVNTSP